MPDVERNDKPQLGGCRTWQQVATQRRRDRAELMQGGTGRFGIYYRELMAVPAAYSAPLQQQNPAIVEGQRVGFPVDGDVRNGPAAGLLRGQYPTF
jgi:hypothetical protein